MSKPRKIRDQLKLVFGCLAAFLAFSSCPASSSELSKFGCGGPKDIDYDFESNELGYAIAADFMVGDFKALVDAANSWKGGKCRFKSGVSQLDYWLSGFTKAFAKNDWKTNLIQIEKFKAAYPDNALSALAESRFWSDFANNARGFGLASSVTPEGWKLFNERLKKSESILLGITATGKEWPQWYWQMIRVQSLLERPDDVIQKTFLEGINKYPDALAIYAEKSYYSEPRWGGSWVTVDKLVQFAERNVQYESKNVTYTRMYLETAGLASSPSSFFSDTKVSWDRMRDGFVDLIHLYPESTWLGNNFLLYACVVIDKATYKKYRKSIEKHDDRLWTLEDRNSCDQAMQYIE